MDELVKALAGSGIRPVLCQKLIGTYEKARKANLIGSPEDLSTTCGRFAEQAIAIIYEKGTTKTVDENGIGFETCYREIENLPASMKTTPTSELLFVTLPRVLRSIYTIRNKKEGAHTKAFSVTAMDKRVMMNLCNWSLAQLVFFFGKDAALTEGVLPKITLESIPTFQEFEDGRVAVFKKLSEERRLLLIIYYKDQRIGRDELERITGLKRPNLRTCLAGLKDDTLIDENENGVVITNAGKIEIEKNAKIYLELS